MLGRGRFYFLKIHSDSTKKFSETDIINMLEFNVTFHYIDGVLSLSNSRFSDFVDRIYPIELEIQGTTDTDHR